MALSAAIALSLKGMQPPAPHRPGNPPQKARGVCLAEEQTEEGDLEPLPAYETGRKRRRCRVDVGGGSDVGLLLAPSQRTGINTRDMSQGVILTDRTPLEAPLGGKVGGWERGVRFRRPLVGATDDEELQFFFAFCGLWWCITSLNSRSPERQSA